MDNPPSGEQGLYNKTDPSNTNLSNTNLKNRYILLPQDAHNFINSYAETYKQYLNKDHMRVTEVNRDYLLEWVDMLIDADIGIKKFKIAIEEHFINRPKTNNGNIMAFMAASKRIFGVDSPKLEYK